MTFIKLYIYILYIKLYLLYIYKNYIYSFIFNFARGTGLANQLITDYNMVPRTPYSDRYDLH